LSAVKILPLYLPPVEWLHRLHQATVIYIDSNSVWRKQTLISRTRILSANGVQTLSVPVRHTGGKAIALKDIRISYHEAWVRVHKGAMFSAYNTSPFFDYFREELFQIIDRRPEFLVDLNLALLDLLLRKFKCKAPVEEFSNQHIDIELSAITNETELRDNLSPYPEYSQVFSYKHPYQPYLSAIDLLSNKGGW
jgi:hypothetical protein